MQHRYSGTFQTELAFTALTERDLLFLGLLHMRTPRLAVSVVHMCGVQPSVCVSVCLSRLFPCGKTGCFSMLQSRRCDLVACADVDG